MSDLDDALTRAASRLRAEQSRDGAWRDFWTPSGTSDEWVTAYTGAALALARDARSRAAAQNAWAYLLKRQRTDGGWGYAADVPSDVDSTSWALTLAARIGVRRTRPVCAALEFVQSARVARGVATYPNALEIARYIGTPPGTSFAGWTQAHACVTAAAAQVPSLRDLLCDDVRAAQLPNGSWLGYWWFDDAYATATSVTALATGSARDADEAVVRACGWAQLRLRETTSPSPFGLSLLLTILTHCIGTALPCSQAGSTLLATQTSKGGWCGSARLRIPRPEVEDPATIETWERWWGAGYPFDIYSIDQCSTFTTATAFSALQSWSRSEASDVFFG